MRTLIAFFVLALACSLAVGGEKGNANGKKWRWTPPYKDDPAVIAKLKTLGENTAAWIGPVKVEGLPEAYRKSGRMGKGPFTRGYCLKMPYAPDRKTAFYCGQDHNLPHYNDAWEYHLGSNTWHCLTPPDGGNTINAWRSWPGALKKEKDPARRKEIEARITKWMKANVKFEKGYLQTRVNDGPVFAWHTWDGLTYDPRTGKMYWAVLDDQKTQEHYLRAWCKYTGRDFEVERKKLKPGIGMWAFDPGTRKWARWLGGKPHPRMRGMGCTLQYIPDVKKIIYYNAAFNIAGGELSMWSYDAVADKWAQMNPTSAKGAKGLWNMLTKTKEIPYSELQAAYSAKHKTMVTVHGKNVYRYDIRKNQWSRGNQGKEHPSIAAHDNHTVFDYDSANDLFLLLQPRKKPVTFWAYSLTKDEWTELKPEGAGPPAGLLKGYYDPGHNVFLATDRGKVWVYRYRKAAAKSPVAKPKPAAPKKAAAAAPAPARKAPARTPKQVCTGWFSAARNYRRVGMLADARRCLKNIISTYPKSEWARQARSELGKL